MPDFERLTRKLESDFAQSPEERAFTAGKHAGLDKARKQIAWIAFAIAAIVVVAACALPR